MEPFFCVCTSERGERRQQDVNVSHYEATPNYSKHHRTAQENVFWALLCEWTKWE
ncbi:hypothetical protein PAMP_018654 [Pampus punctatissimus]